MRHHILDAPAGTGIAGYTVERLLGAGGRGVVYRARRGGEVVALKLQPLEPAGAWAAREGSVLARLEHPNVVGFRECGLLQELGTWWHFLAMEYVPGRTLEEWVEEENPGARRAAELLRGMARGLAAAHAARVVHRDIKESNVMVREEDGAPVLVDFGLGEGDLTPGYRSPESRAVSPRERYVPSFADDLYALGIVFYRVLTARHPFAGEDSPDGCAPVPPHVLNPRAPPALGALCLRLLSGHPEQRGSALELCEAVEAALEAADADWELPLCDAQPEPGGAPRRGRRARPVQEATVLRVRAPLANPPRTGAWPRAVALLVLAACGVVAAQVSRAGWPDMDMDTGFMAMSAAVLPARRGVPEGGGILAASQSSTRQRLRDTWAESGPWPGWQAGAGHSCPPPTVPCLHLPGVVDCACLPRPWATAGLGADAGAGRDDAAREGHDDVGGHASAGHAEARLRVPAPGGTGPHAPGRLRPR